MKVNVALVYLGRARSMSEAARQAECRLGRRLRLPAIGKFGNWRLLKREDGVQGYNQVPGIVWTPPEIN